MIGHKPSLHLNVVFSKAALSGPSVCLRARAPCPLRVSCLRITRERTALVFPAGADHWIAPSVQQSCRLWRSGGSLGLDKDVAMDREWSTYYARRGCKRRHNDVDHRVCESASPKRSTHIYG